MKVISIKQPWASLIMSGYKNYEFRSWKTNYRGKILIHASLNTDKDAVDKYKHLNLDYPTGCILGEVNITDCIKVDSVFENDLKQVDNIVYNSNYIGQYAFKLENVIKYKTPILAKGQLGIWNFNQNI